MAEAQEYALAKGIDLLSMIQGAAVKTEVKEDEGDGSEKE